MLGGGCEIGMSAALLAGPEPDRRVFLPSSKTSLNVAGAYMKKIPTKDLMPSSNGGLIQFVQKKRVPEATFGTRAERLKKPEEIAKYYTWQY